MLKTEEVDAFMKKFKADYGFDITAPRVYDFVEGFEYRRDNPNDTSGIEYGFRYAICLPKQYGKTLLDRAAWLENENNNVPADATVDLEAFALLADHGVKETVNLKCKECGASKERPLSIDALSFLPYL